MEMVQKESQVSVTCLFICDKLCGRECAIENGRLCPFIPYISVATSPQWGEESYYDVIIHDKQLLQWYHSLY